MWFVLVFFLCVTIISFFRFGWTWMVHPNKWHIGCMSMSYVCAMLLIATLVNERSTTPQYVLLAATMALGMSGLARYWIMHE